MFSVKTKKISKTDLLIQSYQVNKSGFF